MPAVKKPAVKPRNATKTDLTVADLVLLSLLAEQPMHGYQANLELERRQVQDWAGVSRPQVYYSLEKLARLGLIAETGDHEPALGPERRIFSTTAKGRTALAASLEREDWTNQRERPPFLTWMALSWQASPGDSPEANPASREVPGNRIGAGRGDIACGGKGSGPPLS